MRVYIEELFERTKVRYYGIRLENEEDFAYDQFLDEFRNSSKSKERFDLRVIKHWIDRVGNELGAEFDEGKPSFRNERAADGLPPDDVEGNKLRLYCCVCSDDIVILGGGGRKLSRKAQLGRETAYPFQVMDEVARIVRSRLKNGRIRIENKRLVGDYQTLEIFK